jgi:hypothetical protein
VEERPLRDAEPGRQPGRVVVGEDAGDGVRVGRVEAADHQSLITHG